MLRRILAALIVLALGLAAGGWLLTAPHPDTATDIAGLTGNADRGRLVLDAAGCASCHRAPDSDAEGDPLLAGGQRFATDFGTFVAPNITPDEGAGIGAWTDQQIATAITAGVTPDDRHLYPAFPYRAYALADPQDIADLIAYLRTLPASDAVQDGHDLAFPYSIRRGVGVWKLMAGTPEFVVTGELSDEATRGRYLAEALGHCAECHTARDGLGLTDTSRWLAGAPNPSGTGNIPNITPGGLDWSETDIAAYLRTGLTPDYDSAGGEMAVVVGELGKLPNEDHAALAAYLKAVAPVE